MIVLMNDTVLDVDLAMLASPATAGRFRALSLEYVLQLGRELYAEAPLLHREDPYRAGRLAALIASKAPRVNAARFDAPHAGCAPAEVDARLEEASPETLVELQARQRSAVLTPYAADREVWRRMAA